MEKEKNSFIINGHNIKFLNRGHISIQSGQRAVITIQPENGGALTYKITKGISKLPYTQLNQIFDQLFFGDRFIIHIKKVKYEIKISKENV